MSLNDTDRDILLGRAVVALEAATDALERVAAALEEMRPARGDVPEGAALRGALDAMVPPGMRE